MSPPHPASRCRQGYADFFKSIDGKQRTMVAEATGGPTWYTEFNVLTGMSARSFGDLKFYVTRIAAGRVTRGLPQALQRCGYKTVSLYPTYGDFLGARAFQKGVGVEQFIDMADMGVDEDMQPDKFYFDQALKAFADQQPSQSPVFMFVYLTANHFPWTSVYRPDLTPDWTPPGNTAGDRRIHSPPEHDGKGLRRFHRPAGARLSGPVVPGAAFRRSSAGDFAETARARHRPEIAGATPDGGGSALLLDLLCARRDQLLSRPICRRRSKRSMRPISRS